MKAIKTSLLSTMAAALFALVGLSSCNSNSDIPDNDPVMTDIVTLGSVSKDGSVVTLREKDDSPLVTLTFPQRIDTAIIKPGQRFMLSYYPADGKPYTSGPATAYAYTDIPNITMTEGTRAENASWMSEDVNVIQLWRTGTWLNLNAFVGYKTAPRKTALVLDKETIDKSMPTAYLLYESDLSAEAEARQFVATFDIISVWANPKYKGLVVKVANPGGPTSYTFYKDKAENFEPVD